MMRSPRHLIRLTCFGLMALAGAAQVEAQTGSFITEVGFLKGLDTAAPLNPESFGRAVAVSGDTLVVGAPFDLLSIAQAHVFVRSGDTWIHEAVLEASNPDTWDWFGHSVAISGERIAIGAPFEDGSAQGINRPDNDDWLDGGAVYVFVRRPSGWVQEAYVKPHNSDVGLHSDRFGYSVALSGNTLVVGAPWEDSDASGINGDGSNNDGFRIGAAYVFVHENGAWQHQAYIKPPVTTDQHDFAERVAVSGDTLVLSDIRSPDDSRAGLAQVYDRVGATWSHSATLAASNADPGDRFGFSLAIDQDTIVVGADNEDGGNPLNPTDNSAFAAGAAYVFERSGGTWSEVAYLKATSPRELDFFGDEVCVSAGLIAVGAPSEDGGVPGVNTAFGEFPAKSSGAAFIFRRDELGGDWPLQAHLKASNLKRFERFGSSVAVGGESVFVGAPDEASDVPSGEPCLLGNKTWGGIGAVYVFDPEATEPSPWSHEGGASVGLSGLSPRLTGIGPLAAGSSNEVALYDARGSAPFAFYFAHQSRPVPFSRGTLFPNPPLTLTFGVTDSKGNACLPIVLPPGFPAGTEVWVQAAVATYAATSGGPVGNKFAQPLTFKDLSNRFDLSNAVLGITR